MTKLNNETMSWCTHCKQLVDRFKIIGDMCNECFAMLCASRKYRDEVRKETEMITCAECKQITAVENITCGVCISCISKEKYAKISKEQLDELWNNMKAMSNVDYDEAAEMFSILREVYIDNGMKEPSDEYEITVTITTVQDAVFWARGESGTEASYALLELLEQGNNNPPIRLGNVEKKYQVEQWKGCNDDKIN